MGAVDARRPRPEPGSAPSSTIAAAKTARVVSDASATAATPPTTTSPAPRTIVLAANAPAREGAPVMRFLAGLA